MSQSDRQSYATTLKSTSIVGGAQAISVLIGLVRMKFVAVLLGTAGVGLFDTYQTLILLLSSIAGLGISSSGVREVAESTASGDEVRVAKTATALRRICWLTGGIGLLLTAFMAVPLSLTTFDTTNRATSFVILSPVILFAVLRQGQVALVQGTRRIRQLATLNVLGTFAGTVLSIGLFAWLGEAGILPTLLLTALLNLVFSWYFARQIKVVAIDATWMDSIRKASGLVRLGVSIMLTGIMVAGVAYATRVMIQREIGLSAVGIFGTAYALSGVVVNFVLGAMSADYYPRLSSSISDRTETCRLVNEQTEIGLLLAFPGLLATITLAPWIVSLLATPDFAAAGPLLRWFAMGCMGRVISWPLSYIILAQGRSLVFGMTETTFNLIHLVLISVLLSKLGVLGVSIAFFVAYVGYTFGMLLVARRLVGFSWQPSLVRLIVALTMVTFVTFMSCTRLPVATGLSIGLLITLLASIVCLRRIAQRLGDSHRITRTLNSVPLLRRLF